MLTARAGDIKRDHGDELHHGGENVTLLDPVGPPPLVNEWTLRWSLVFAVLRTIRQSSCKNSKNQTPSQSKSFSGRFFIEFMRIEIFSSQKYG